MGSLTRVKWIGLLVAVLMLFTARSGSAQQQPALGVPLPMLPAPRATDRILVVSPHPDDETIGAGGYLDQAAQAGATIRIVVATDGAKRGRSSTRYRETLSALSKLGVPAKDVIFLGYPDGRLSQQKTFQARLESISADFHPNIVIATHPNDTHPDHAAVGRAVDLLGQHSNHTVTAYFFVVHYPHYPQPDAYRPDEDEVPAPHLPDSVSHWEGLPLPDQIVQAKRDAVLEYHTQILRRNPLRRGLLISFIRKSEIFAVRSY
ncbi:MAG TPA: PIG-L family deacetylase [Fimbriimonadaceae bacterium]|nr:PIG-L family deacetylase [Fimbriimonadaceae bacterium]